ncbi:hypothetical protein [Halorhabdus sp. CUG00001]|uniref:hypothetical protein n=1 Tax=Halorhabdus sp. CUG00001 TaxID=2600297 RepID=UPI00131A8FBA|nr:hypothetical protein [Halorhabdus sp. CUG00001]
MSDKFAKELNETKLLLLERQMEGNTSTLRFDVQLAALEGATFKGTEGHNMRGARPVRETDDAGTIDLIKFRVEYEGEPLEPERNVLLKIDQKGRVNCQTYVQPQLLDAVLAELNEIEKVEQYLSPLSDHIQTHVENYLFGKSPSKIDRYRDDTNYGFNNLISHYFDQERLTEAETRLFKSIIANLCIEISKNGIPDPDSMSEVTSMDNAELPTDGEEHLEQFFEYCSEENDLSDWEFEELVPHIVYLSEREWTQPINTLQEVTDLYDLD